MHRNTKRLAAALLAAVLCTAAAVPQAAAEPWTYEVDDVMASYGVEYYPDVGFENPRRTADESTQSAGSGTGVYGGGESGIAMYAVDNTTDTTDVTGGYTVDIPAEVNIGEGETTKILTVKADLEPYRVLKITVQGNGSLKYGADEDTEYTIPYTAAWKNATGQDATSYTVDTDASKQSFTADVNIELRDTEKARLSGEYTDTLTFTLDARPKTYTVIYHSNTGSAEETRQSVFTYGNPAKLTENTFVNSGHHFAGWTKSTTPCTTHEEIDYADKATVLMSDFTLTEAENGLDYKTDLYAQWGYLYQVKVDRETVNAAFGEDIAVEHSVVLMPNESYSWERPDDYGWKENESRKDTAGNTVLAWEPLTATVADISQDTTQTYRVTRKRYRIDMNNSGVSLGTDFSKNDFAKADVYVNGEQAATDVGDFWKEYPWGSTFAVKVTMINTDYEVASITYANGMIDNTYATLGVDVGVNGYNCGKLTGTQLIKGDTTVTNASTIAVVFRKKTQTTTDDTATTLLPSLDETTPVVVDMPTVDTAADEPAATPDSTEPADIAPTAPAADTPADVPETTPDELMIWDAADFRLPQEEWDDWT